LGAGIQPGQSDRPTQHIDVAATGAAVLGARTGEIGEGLDEMPLLASPDFPLLKTNSRCETLCFVFSRQGDWLLV
jgi:hypothetical protein